MTDVDNCFGEKKQSSKDKKEWGDNFKQESLGF